MHATGVMLELGRGRKDRRVRREEETQRHNTEPNRGTSVPLPIEIKRTWRAIESNHRNLPMAIGHRRASKLAWASNTSFADDADDRMDPKPQCNGPFLCGDSDVDSELSTNGRHLPLGSPSTFGSEDRFIQIESLRKSEEAPLVANSRCGGASCPVAREGLAAVAGPAHNVTPILIPNAVENEQTDLILYNGGPPDARGSRNPPQPHMVVLAQTL
ncbi:hypothetical protein BKA70DRAFT_1234168 [Coprinopsis sp. MPI-PUGE-AT-0042]|nr:hypothetical protein BKA70DRAFT_1234168 [Coprinopsis sp. MPI-PUGE-AT-0042]